MLLPLRTIQQSTMQQPKTLKTNPIETPKNQQNNAAEFKVQTQKK